MTNLMCEFARAANKVPRNEWLKQQKITVSWLWKLRVPDQDAGRVGSDLRAQKEGSVPGLALWFLDGRLPSTLYISLPSMGVHLQMSPLHKSTCHVGLGTTNFHWITSINTSSLNKVIF